MIDYHGAVLEPVCHLYNMTWLNERAVELAVAHWWLGQLPVDVLGEGVEVGNVLSHYAFRHHLVVDRDEPAAWYQVLAGQPVANMDVLDFAAHTARRFPWVASLSTVEHTADPVRTLLVLHDLLSPGGRLLVTFPTGVRPELDAVVAGDVYFDWTRACTATRVAGGQEWAIDPAPVISPYGQWANSVFVAEWQAPCES